MVNAFQPIGTFAATSYSGYSSGSGQGHVSPSMLMQPGMPPSNATQLLSNALQTILPVLEHSGMDTSALEVLARALESLSGGTHPANCSTGAQQASSMSTLGESGIPISTPAASLSGGSPSSSIGASSSVNGSGAANSSNARPSSQSPSGATQAQLTKEPSEDPNAVQAGILQDFKRTSSAPQQAVAALSNPSAEPIFQSPPSTPEATYRSPSGATSLWGNGTVQTGPSSAVSTSVAGLATQGEVGDCYALASWSAYAQQNPQAAKDMVRPDPSGTPGQYQVNLNYKDQQSGENKSAWVSVDDKFPMVESPPSSGQYHSAVADLPKDSSGQTILGPALIEKAFAKFNDAHQVTQGANQNPPLTGYAGIAGGTGPEALYTFSGKETSTLLAGQGKTFSEAGTTPENVKSVLSAANQGKPVMSATKSTADGGANGNEAPDSQGILANHQYTVLGTSTDSGGHTTVQLRNPQGDHSDPKTAGNGNNGVFTMTLEQYMKEFGQVSMGH